MHEPAGMDPKALFTAWVGAFDAAGLEHENVVASHTAPSVSRDHVNAETGVRFDVLQIVYLTFHREGCCPGAQVENMKAGLLGQIDRIGVKAKSVRVTVYDRLNIVPAVVLPQAPEIGTYVISKNVRGCREKQGCNQKNSFHTTRFK